jgi:hypothetical protein
MQLNLKGPAAGLSNRSDPSMMVLAALKVAL